MDYSVAETALLKWGRTRLTVVDDSESVRHYQFRYSGSTCTNGGTPFEAFLHVRLSMADQQIVSAWIDIPESERSRASAMCAAGSAPRLFEKLASPTSFCGSLLEEAIQTEVPLNYAGCFCSQAMINEKWKAALSTVHYALHHDGLPK